MTAPASSRMSSTARSKALAVGTMVGALQSPDLRVDAREKSCTSSLFIPSYGTSLAHAVLLALQSASDDRELEDYCAEKIQSVFRMYQQRREYRKAKLAVLSMQRLFRGHVVRMAVHDTVSNTMKDYERQCFDYYATRIQAIFRGFHSRKHVDDYYARRAYIRKVTSESDQVLKLAGEQRQCDDELTEAEEKQREAEAYVRATQQVHFMLSTVGVSGVYRRRGDPEGIQTVPFESNVEEDIRHNTMVLRREERKKERELQLQRKKAKASKEHQEEEEESPLRGAAGSGGVGEDSDDEGSEGKWLYGSEMPMPLEPTRPFEMSSHGKGSSGRGGTIGVRCVTNHAGPHLLTSSTAQTCYWEERTALPPQRAMVAPEHCCRKRHPDDFKQHSTESQPPPKGPVTAIQSWKTPSTFHLKYKGKGHDCLLPPIQTTYNTEAAALQKSVDRQYVAQLHQSKAFKVPLYAPEYFPEVPVEKRKTRSGRPHPGVTASV